MQNNGTIAMRASVIAVAMFTLMFSLTKCIDFIKNIHPNQSKKTHEKIYFLGHK